MVIPWKSLSRVRCNCRSTVKGRGRGSGESEILWTVTVATLKSPPMSSAKDRTTGPAKPPRGWNPSCCTRKARSLSMPQSRGTPRMRKTMPTVAFGGPRSSASCGPPRPRSGRTRCRRKGHILLHKDMVPSCQHTEHARLRPRGRAQTGRDDVSGQSFSRRREPAMSERVGQSGNRSVPSGVPLIQRASALQGYCVTAVLKAIRITIS